MIPEGSPPFIVLAYSAGMIAVSLALLNLIQYLGLSRLTVFPKVSAFTYVLASVIGFLLAQFFSLVNIFFRFHLFDMTVISLFIVENAFIAVGIVWLITYRKEPIRRPP